MTSSNPFTDKLEQINDAILSVENQLNSVIVGQSKLIEALLQTYFSNGHILLEGMPGLGKTQLVKALGELLALPVSRIQCTPDLMSADVTGSELLIYDSNQLQSLKFQPGPIFSPLVLVDEINRATPKTQAAFLEAMQEHQVTYLGKRYDLPQPFCLIATQNPIELEGTYPLPEAQLDRFTTKLDVLFPDSDSLLDLVNISLDNEPAKNLKPQLSQQQCIETINFGRQVFVADAVKNAAIQIILATQPTHQHGHPLAQQHFRYGASPRAIQSLIRVARVRALMKGRPQVALEDLASCAIPVLHHRILLSMESEIRGDNIHSLLSEIVETCLGNLDQIAK